MTLEERRFLREASEEEIVAWRRRRRAERRRQMRAAGKAAVPSAGVALLPLLTHMNVYGEYGWTMFTLVPIMIGFLTTLFLGREDGRDWKHGSRATGFALAMVGIGLMIGYFEGICCLLMALPVAIPSGLLGAYLGTRLWQALDDRLSGSARLSLGIALPLLLAVVPGPVARSERTITTEWIVEAEPVAVWPLLFDLPSLPPPEAPVFWLRMAYPVATRTVGDRRECVLTTGVMPERIVIRDRERRLRFEVLATPPTMREVNPFGEVRASHLERSFRCQWGEFRLEPLGGGRCRVVATSAYEHDFAPDLYWSLYTDAVVRGVHRQVLGEIERRAERTARAIN